MKNAINWFEIPAADFDRACRFYETIFNVTLERAEMGEMRMAMFSTGEDGISGAIATSPMHEPGASGPILYLNGGDDLSTVLAHVDGAGGRTLVPKTLVTEEIGYFAIFLDTEGNRLALHSAH